jgi:hypothetical protein
MLVGPPDINEMHRFATIYSLLHVLRSNLEGQVILLHATVLAEYSLR